MDIDLNQITTLDEAKEIIKLQSAQLEHQAALIKEQSKLIAGKVIKIFANWV